MLVRRLANGAAALLGSLAILAMIAPGAALAAGKGVLNGSVPMRGMSVALFAASGGNEQPVVLGRARSTAAGSFSLSYKASGSGTVKYLVATRPGGAAEAGFPVPASAYRLAAALGAGAVPRRVTVNERTTVAIGYAMAQFVDGARFAGKNPGLRNAAAMTHNLVNRRGGLSPVLERFPNGAATSTLATFDSLANLLGSCRAQGPRCAQLLRLAGVPGGGPAADTLAATANLARYPWHNAGALYKLSLRARGRYVPALAPGERPDGWTLALRFEGGSPRGLDGPGNFAIDAGGNLWVGNNYEYSRRSRQPSCFGREMLRFTPTGRYFPGSPYASGGLSGVGFGITIDPFDHVWAGNFGFAGKGCGEEPPSNSVSEFNLRGEALSPTWHRPGKGKSPKASSKRPSRAVGKTAKSPGRRPPSPTRRATSGSPTAATTASPNTSKATTKPRSTTPSRTSRSTPRCRRTGSASAARSGSRSTRPATLTSPPTTAPPWSCSTAKARCCGG